jgi:phosphoribosylcarboxyaminoimidazole (NCAIR) mutase
VRVTLYVVAMPSGIYVQTVYIGSSTGEATLTDATAIALKLVERTAAGISRPAVSPASTPTSAAR